LRGDHGGAGASYPIPRGFAGPNLLAMVSVNKFLLHQPLIRQSKTYALPAGSGAMFAMTDRLAAPIRWRPCFYYP